MGYLSDRCGRTCRTQGARDICDCGVLGGSDKSGVVLLRWNHPLSESRPDQVDSPGIAGWCGSSQVRGGYPVSGRDRRGSSVRRPRRIDRFIPVLSQLGSENDICRAWRGRENGGTNGGAVQNEGKGGAGGKTIVAGFLLSDCHNTVYYRHVCLPPEALRALHRNSPWIQLDGLAPRPPSGFYHRRGRLRPAHSLRDRKPWPRLTTSRNAKTKAFHRLERKICSLYPRIRFHLLLDARYAGPSVIRQGGCARLKCRGWQR
jgi:hypothetical protein